MQNDYLSSMMASNRLLYVESSGLRMFADVDFTLIRLQFAC